MTKLTVHGIKNCETMKKAFAWLDEHKVSYGFHDYKKSGADEELLKRAIKEYGWENVLNRKGTTWRSLPDKVKEGMTDASAFETAMANPSIIRRPMLALGMNIHFGFDAGDYAKIFRKQDRGR